MIFTNNFKLLLFFTSYIVIAEACESCNETLVLQIAQTEVQKIAHDPFMYEKSETYESNQIPPNCTYTFYIWYVKKDEPIRKNKYIVDINYNPITNKTNIEEIGAIPYPAPKIKFHDVS